MIQERSKNNCGSMIKVSLLRSSRMHLANNVRNENPKIERELLDIRNFVRKSSQRSLVYPARNSLDKRSILINGRSPLCESGNKYSAARLRDTSIALHYVVDAHPGPSWWLSRLTRTRLSRKARERARGEKRPSG